MTIATLMAATKPPIRYCTPGKANGAMPWMVSGKAYPVWYAKGRLDAGRRYHDRVSSAAVGIGHPAQQLAVKGVNVKADLRRPPFRLRVQALVSALGEDVREIHFCLRRPAFFVQPGDKGVDNAPFITAHSVTVERMRTSRHTLVPCFLRRRQADSLQEKQHAR